MNNKKTFQRCVSLFITTIIWITSSAVQAGEALTLAVSQSPLSLPIFVAESQGYFSSEGVTVKLKEINGGHRTLQALLDGEADLATSSDAVIMFNSFRRNDFAVIATFVSSRDDVKIIVGKESGIVKPSQMTGKRVATVVGSASNYFLDTWMLLHDVDPKSVKIINLQPEAMESALSKGEVDAVAIWEPFPFKLANAGLGAKVLPNPGTYVLTFNLVVHKKLIGMRDDELVKLLRALARAQRFIRDEPAKAQAILRSKLKLDQAFIDWIWPRNNYALSLDQSLLSTLESEARWARQEGHVAENRKINYLDFIYVEPLLKVSPKAVGIKK
ncbi:MAG: ABC transporter substrate-binding protein [Gallionellaceae bacterium]